MFEEHPGVDLGMFAKVATTGGEVFPGDDVGAGSVPVGQGRSATLLY